ncbi:MBL fold metallo-hydrolase [Corynebacterium breve]|uniref:MBL fold metallo-hydrolase n=1 Tax=Corynebacterium breve TaxID=3049799 RepID=A0ABY8VG51_9CORY|nr:MBL fold metallo-hydrolase [Corynebacterium breve]WIM67248.1 MBL fold metallo-hydrolase [Corynebacterium breve]
MQLTILGCSGSLAAPGNPGSSYLVTLADSTSIVMDLGPGSLAALEGAQNPSDAHVVFSHLHADHCSDFISLLIWRQYHPEMAARSRNLMFGPTYAPEHFGRMGGNGPSDIIDFSDTLAFGPWVPHQKELLGSATITPFPVLHPAQESYALRVEESNTGKVLTYSGDTAYTQELVDAARGADVFLCEAAWGPSSEGMAPDMHMSGGEAGRVAREAGVNTLVLVHIQPWADKEETAAAAAKEFDGDIIVGYPGQVLDV